MRAIKRQEILKRKLTALGNNVAHSGTFEHFSYTVSVRSDIHDIEFENL